MIIAKQGWLRRLERLRQKHDGKRETHYLFPLPGENSDAQIASLIASGRARPTDEFIIFCWGEPAAPASGAGQPASPRAD